MWFKVTHESHLTDACAYDPIYGLELLQRADLSAEGFCKACVKDMRSRWKDEQARLWSKLDEWLELDGVGSYDHIPIHLD